MNFNLEYPILDLGGDELQRRVLTSSDWENVFSQTQPFALNLAHSSVSDDDLACLKEQTELRAIDLESTNITPVALEHLSKYTWLESLCLYYLIQQVSNRELQVLSNLPKLRFLNLGSCVKVTTKGLLHLAKLSDLEYLSISDCGGITDTVFVAIAKLKKLQVLDAGMSFGRHNDCTDKGISTLANLSLFAN